MAGGVQKPQKKNLIQDPKGTLGISESGFGFTKKNEVRLVVYTRKLDNMCVRFDACGLCILLVA